MHKSLPRNEIHWRTFGKYSVERAVTEKKEEEKKHKTERATGLVEKNKREDRLRSQMTALRFQTGEETSDIPGLPSGMDRQTIRVLRQYNTRPKMKPH